MVGLLFWTLFKTKNIKLDELYFHTKRQALEVHIFLLIIINPFVKPTNKFTPIRINLTKGSKNFFGG